MVSARRDDPVARYSSYSIDDGNGNQLCAGLPAHTAREIAQRKADELGEAVWLYKVDGSDTDEERPSVEIQPNPFQRAQ